jgi:glutamate 5-kinase
MTQAEIKPALLARARRIVVKIGSNVLAEADGRASRLPGLVRELAELGRSREVVVVTSGAVAAGRSRMRGSERRLEWRQAAAAVGQSPGGGLSRRSASGSAGAPIRGRRPSPR